MKLIKKHNLNIIKRRIRVRSKLTGTKSRPRLSISKSNYALSASIINDIEHRVLGGFKVKGKNKQAAKALSEQIILLSKKNKFKSVVFDRGEFKYHGVIKDFVDNLKEGGIKI